MKVEHTKATFRFSIVASNWSHTKKRIQQQLQHPNM